MSTPRQIANANTSKKFFLPMVVFLEAIHQKRRND